MPDLIFKNLRTKLLLIQQF